MSQGSRGWLGLVLLACGTESSPTVLIDADGDGYASVESGGEDCNDQDPDISPFDPEVCGDGVDNNCDGVVDDNGVGAVTWYPDNDGDGFGVLQGAVQACPSAGGGLTNVQGDCNDEDAAIHPQAEDRCDLVDNDCDDDIDEDAGQASHLGIAYPLLLEAVEVATKAAGPQVVELCARAEPRTISTLSIQGSADLTLRGVGPRSEVIIAAGQVEASGKAKLTLEGLVLADAGLRVSGAAQVDTRDVLIEVPGQGVVLVDTTGAVVNLVDSEIRGDARGIDANGDYELTLEGSSVLGSKTGGGIVVRGRDGHLVLRDSLIEGNHSVTNGGGVFVDTLGSFRVFGSVIGGNTATNGAGVYLRNTDLRGDKYPLLTENVASQRGGGAYLVQAELRFVNVATNEAREGGGIYVAGESGSAFPPRSELLNCEVRGNEADYGGGLYLAEGASLEMTNCTVEQNLATVVGGGAGGGAFIELGQGSTFESIQSDWAEQGLLDNVPTDVETSLGQAFAVGSSLARFFCGEVGGCN